MEATCTVYEAGTFDPESGAPTPGATVYAGKCEVSGDRPYESNPEAAGATATVQRYILKVPWDAGPFRAGLVARIDASRLQPNLVGREFRIAGPDERSYQTAQRMFIDSTR
jgi:hypothetical protein